jgi:hypothetical protein
MLIKKVEIGSPLKKQSMITSIIDKESVYFDAFFFYFSSHLFTIKIVLKSVSLRFAKNYATNN